MQYKEIFQLIQREGFRLTSARKNIVKVLCEHSEYLGAYDIHHILEQGGQHVGIVSIYRVLEMLNSLGLLQREEFSSGSERFRLLNKAEHAHQLVCTKCGRTKELDVCPISHFAKSLEQQSGYHIQDHWLRFFGLCPLCQPPEKPKDSPF